METERKTQTAQKDIFRSYAKLRSLTREEKGRIKDFKTIFLQMAELLKNAGERGRVQFTIGIGDEQQHWCLDLDEKTSELKTGKHAKPDLVIVTRAETMKQIAEGTISPIEAFGKGNLRVQGDLELGLRLYKRLALPEGKFGPCI